MKDKEYRKTIVNPIHIKEVKGHLKYLGTNSEIDILGKTDFEVFPKKLAQKFFVEDQKVIRDGSLVLDDEGLGYSEEGNQLCLLVSKIPLRDNKGEIIGMVGVATDITERKQAEEALLENERRLSSIYDTVGDVIYHLAVGADGSYRFISVNKAFYNVIGLSEEMVVGKLVNEVIPEPSLSMVLGKYRQAIKEKSVIRWEETSDYPTGRLTGDVSIAPVFDNKGHCTHLVGAVHDITERKQAEDALVESETKYRQLVAKSPDGIFIIDLSGTFLSVNKAMCDSLKYTEEEFLSMKIWDIVPEQFRSLHKQRLAAIIKGESTKAKAEYEVKGKDGITHSIEVLSVPYYNGKKIIGFQGIARDITERKLAEKFLEESEEKFSVAFKTSPYILAITRIEEGQLIEVNDAFYSITGYIPEETRDNATVLMGLWVDGEDRNRMLKELLGGGKVEGKEFKFKKKNGEILTGLFSAQIIHLKGEQFMLSSINDITDRKRTEVALQTSKDFLDKIINSVASPIFVKDHKHKFCLVNSALCSLLNLPVEKLIGITGYEYFPKEQMEIFIAKDEEVFKTGNENINEEFLTDGQGKIRTIITRKTLYTDMEGNKFLVGIINDITERVLAEEALKMSEEKFRVIFNSASDGMFLVDINTRKFFMCNATCARMLGHTQEEFPNLDITDIHPAEDLPFIYEQLGMFSRGEEGIRSDIKFKRKNGDVFFTDLSPTLITIAGKKFLLIIFRDITERKLAEEALASEQYLMYALMNNVPDRIYFKDRESRYIRISKAQAQLFGLSDPAQAAGKSDFDFFTGEHARQAYDDEQEIIRNGQPINKEEKETWPDRPDTWVYSTKLPLRDKEGNIIGTFGISMDITARKEIELLLIQKNQEIESQNEEYLALNDEIEQTNKELLLAKEKAEESDKLKTAFLQNMSHEIRTPMNGILGFAELLKNPKLTETKQQEFIHIIEKSGLRMLNIINDIVNISKIETGQIELDIQETNVNSLLQHLHTFFGPDAERKGLSLSFKTGLPDEISKIETDGVKLTQVLSNLINNALKFTKSGTIDFGYHHKGQALEFYVQDTGIGILPEMQEIIFERFRQVDMADARIYEGAGLGLTISKAFVEKLGGNISVKSELDKGSVFFFNIPYNPKVKIKAEKPLEALLEAKLSGINILIAEDDDVCMELLKETLENENANLFFAYNGQEALDMVKSTPEIQMVLMDLKMPVMNGFEATKLIKKLKPGLPVIAQSAYAFSNDQDKAKMAGCDDFIGKPVQRELLLSKINKQLAKK